MQGGVGRGHLPPSDFGGSVNPVPTRREDYYLPPLPPISIPTYGPDLYDEMRRR